MSDGNTSRVTDAALRGGLGVRTVASGNGIGGSVRGKHDKACRRGIPHEPHEIADRLLAEGAVVRNAARANLVSERQTALGQYFTPMWVARLMAETCAK